MLCTYCQENIEDGFISGRYPYCSVECSEKDWQEDKADKFAFRESGGLYSSYEEYAEYELDAHVVDN